MTKKEKKFISKKYGKKRMHVWSSKKAAQADVKKLKGRGYKVKLTSDKKGVIIIGKTTRGVERGKLGRRSMISQTMRRPSRIPGLPREKPYFTSHFFRQPSLTLRKFGWSK